MIHRNRIVRGAVALIAMGATFGAAAAIVPAGVASAGAAAASCPVGSGSAVPFSGSLTDGTISLGKNLKGTGLTGSACGTLNLDATGGTIDIPAANFSFSPESIEAFGLLKIPSTITVDNDATGTLTVGATSGTYNTTISVQVTSTVSILGQSCTVGPFTPNFTTGTSGSESGSPLTGSLADLSGTVVAGDFTVPAIKSSKTCNGLIAAFSNAIMGFPLAAGASSITNNVAFTLTTATSAAS
jgi:hypothetical protein